MRMLSRTLFVLAVAWLIFVALAEARAAFSQPVVDPSKVVLLFGAVVLVGVIAGVVFVTLIMPSIGDSIGNFFFNPNERIEDDPHAAAQAAFARGDYEEAIEAYRDAYEADPSDTLALSEIARLYCEKMEDPASAAELLENVLEQDLPAEDAAFIGERLVDVYWKFQRNPQPARAILLQIIEALPNTKHSANAEHRLREIERELSRED